jgi:hypothetical protein
MAIGGTLAYDPSQLAGLNPGANTSGSTLGPVGSSIAAPSIGGTSSPFTPAPVTGTNMPAYSSPYSPTGATAGLLGTGLGATSAAGPVDPAAWQKDVAKSFQKSGTMPGGLGTAAAEFLSSGAGFNPQVAQALIAAMQPQIAKGQANLMEQFGSKGLGASSPAALGLGDYLAQTNLDVGTLLSGLYEQSVQNYMQVLNMGHVNVSQQSQQGGGILGALGQMLPGIGQAAGAISQGFGVGGAAGTALDAISAIL